jgi:putative NIF3 family GTP cyclohydrolase 1 type 2
MKIGNISRRELLIGIGACAANSSSGQDGRTVLSAGEIIERIRSNVRVPWREQTVDRIIAGSPDTPVKGIATTMMATLDVVKRASAAGLNLVITHEPTFYSHQDTIDQLRDDPVYRFKLDFMASHNMVSFHFHDHWHAFKPDGIAYGMARELGWEKYMDAENPRHFTLPRTTLAQVAKEIAGKLKIRTMRVLGDPQLQITQAAASWGYASQLGFAARSEAELLIVGETREWELVEYVQDMISSGKKKALIVMGHVVSEQSGMKYCAEWLKTFVSEVPIEFVPAVEPFWSPAAPAG